MGRVIARTYIHLWSFALTSKVRWILPLLSSSYFYFLWNRYQSSKSHCQCYWQACIWINAQSQSWFKSVGESSSSHSSKMAELTQSSSKVTWKSYNKKIAHGWAYHAAGHRTACIFLAPKEFWLLRQTNWKYCKYCLNCYGQKSRCFSNLLTYQHWKLFYIRHKIKQLNPPNTEEQSFSVLQLKKV